MSRLTHRAEEDGVKAVWYGERDVFLEGEIGYAEADKLAHYEDLEDEGRLIELPCAVGDTIYIPNEIFPAEIEEIRVTPQGTFVEYVQYDKGYEETEVWDEGSFCIEDIGKTVFLTSEEAEAKLAEMEGTE